MEAVREITAQVNRSNWNLLLPGDPDTLRISISSLWQERTRVRIT